jgi:class 3 adenylate cyclase
VLVCANCGRENEGDFAFCPYCGAELAKRAGAREQRKTVTVLFCDVAGYTATGERLDPEALRQLQSRYFDAARATLERHGATVEKFIGDAVMAVFGIPQIHEDDALRACLAGLELREVVAALGLEARIGVNTGEVVTGSGDALVTGDAVNVAARLEQAAQPGEILLGTETLTLVRAAVDTVTIEPLELKGKAEPVRAHRLAAVTGDLERAHKTPFVGRATEVEALRQAWGLVLDEGRCERVTIAGEPGMGKSRLTAEFLASLDARIVRGRCPPYGEGITYWPVVEVLRQLDALPTDPAAAASIRSLLGETQEGTSAEEIAWAFRKLVEEQAPLIVVLDDIQWAEETLLDLVEQVALLTDAPILLLCMARPELLDRRPAWPAALRLAPLGDSDVEELIPRRISGQQRDKITRAAGGNPLFIAEMLAMSEEANSDVTVPPTLQALLAARLDQLDPAERRVLECAAIEGEVFHRGAVRALAADEEQVAVRLAALVRRELIRPHRAQVPGDEGFRFRHLLIRDAAYDALPKAKRSELHEHFAAWLQEHGADLVELDEILGYHLEQANGYKAELGQTDVALAKRAGERLAAAGQAALWRVDPRAARVLLERALELLRPLRTDVELELDLAVACAIQHDERRAADIADAAAERAGATGDQAGVADARVAGAMFRMRFAADGYEELESLAFEALPILERAENHAGLVRVWAALGEVENVRGRTEERTRATEQALRHARLAGQPQMFLFGLDNALALGPRPADQALRTLEAAFPDSLDPRLLITRGLLLGMLGRFDDAWPLAQAGSERLREVHGEYRRDVDLAAIAVLEGDHETAARFLRRACELFEKRGLRPTLSTYAPVLGRSLCVLGDYGEAERLIKLGRELGDEQDVMTQMIWRQVLARVYASRDDHSRAEPLVREAVEIAEGTDWLNHQGDALCDLAEVLAAAGRTDAAADALGRALDRYERKMNLAMVAQVRPKLEGLRADTTRGQHAQSTEKGSPRRQLPLGLF